jgi:GT2 family glycosyltransferase
MMASQATLDGAGDEYHCSGLVWRNLHGRPLASHAMCEREVFSPCAGAALYRRTALDEVGGFDESFFCYVEDVDLGYRLQLMNRRCLYLPDAVVHHIGSAISNKYPGFAVYHGHRNLVWAFVKNTPLPLLLLFLPLHLLMTVVLFLVFVKRGQGLLYLRAKKDAVKGLGRVWRQRSAVQAQRKISLWRLLCSYDYQLFRR